MHHAGALDVLRAHGQSVNGTWRSDILTGAFTLTNLATIASGLGAGGERVILGTLNNQVGTLYKQGKYAEAGKAIGWS